MVLRGKIHVTTKLYECLMILFNHFRLEKSSINDQKSIRETKRNTKLEDTTDTTNDQCKPQQMGSIHSQLLRSVCSFASRNHPFQHVLALCCMHGNTTNMHGKEYIFQSLSHKLVSFEGILGNLSVCFCCARYCGDEEWEAFSCK